MGKAEGYLFGFIGVFMAIMGVIYWFSSHDWTGTTCIALASGLGLLVTFYLVFTARRMGPRPEDRAEAEIAEGAGDLAHFSPASAWPIMLAFSAAAALVGFIFGLWITFIAIGGVLFSGVGLLFENFRGVNQATEEATGVDPVGMGGGHG
jgi:hypothetical protein